MGGWIRVKVRVSTITYPTQSLKAMARSTMDTNHDKDGRKI